MDATILAKPNLLVDRFGFQLCRHHAGCVADLALSKLSGEINIIDNARKCIERGTEHFPGGEMQLF